MDNTLHNSPHVHTKRSDFSTFFFLQLCLGLLDVLLHSDVSMHTSHSVFSYDCEALRFSLLGTRNAWMSFMVAEVFFRLPCASSCQQSRTNTSFYNLSCRISELLRATLIQLFHLTSFGSSIEAHGKMTTLTFWSSMNGQAKLENLSGFVKDRPGIVVDLMGNLHDSPSLCVFLCFVSFGHPFLRV